MFIFGLLPILNKLSIVIISLSSKEGIYFIDVFINGSSKSEFYINEESSNGFPRLINLIGIDSPGLTSSLAIAGRVRNLILNI